MQSPKLHPDIAECRNFICTLSLGCKYLRLQSENIRKQMSISFAWCLLRGKCATDFVELQQKRIIAFFVGPYILWKESRYNPEEKRGKKYSEQLASDNFIEWIANLLTSKVMEQEIKHIFEFSCVPFELLGYSAGFLAHVELHWSHVGKTRKKEFEATGFR